ncbi:MAG: EAL domain-containing response regulator [Deltaproteobacteria bacterium]|nr:EAL domain-containing response regulator [Deltaproteobacteria bacterium]
MGTRVLVVDDDAILRRTVERILVRSGYEIIVAKDVSEAVRHASNVPIQAALVDYNLGFETGLQVLSRLRDLQPACLRILMTGSKDFPMVVEAVNRGEVLRVLSKPFDADQLLNTVEEAFASARRMAQLATAQKKAVDLQERQMLEDLLNDRLLSLALQPIVRATGDHEVFAYEALLRSRHPVLDGPLPVLQVAERADRIKDIGRAVFDLAGDWIPQLPEGVRLFVNLHPIQLSDPVQLSKDVARLALVSDRVTVEITERSRLTDIEHWEESIEALQAAGFELAIDDLGAGYNSLTMLADLQPRFIKLDMSLVRHVDTEIRKQRLVQLMATFADATNALLIGEGVETAEEAATLTECGVHLLQGYFFGKPSLTL